MALTKVKGHIIADDLALGGNPTTSTQSTGNNTTRLATTAFVQTELAALADSAPAALNTLNELAAAMGDDASFSTTVTNSIATKAPLASPTLTGNPKINVGTNKNIIFSGGIGEIGSVPGFQAINDAGSANTDFGIRATSIRLATGSAERMRIDSSGEVFVGKTSSSNTTKGFTVDQDGLIQSTKTGSGGQCVFLNRQASDGIHILFRKANSTVGSIGVVGGNNLYINGDTVGLGIGDDNLYPTNAAGASTNGALDIGDSSAKFRNLHLSGIAYIADKVGIGTGSPNDILHVSTAGAATRVRIGNNGSHDASIYFNTATDWSIGTDTSNSNALSIDNNSSVGGAAKMTIGTNGLTNIDASTGSSVGNLRVNGTSGHSYIGANRASAGQGEVGFSLNTGGSTVWWNYLSANDNTLKWYSDSGNKLTLTQAGNLTAVGTINALTLGASGISGNSGNNFALNTPHSLRINIDSDNNATDQDFIIGHNQTAVNQSNILFKVQENGKVGMGITPSEKLHTYVASGSNEFRNQLGSNSVYMRHGVNRNSPQGVNVFDILASQNQDIVIGTSNAFLIGDGGAMNSESSNRLRVDSTGVTIGEVLPTLTTTNESVQRRLWVRGQGVFHSQDQGTLLPRARTSAINIGPSATRGTTANSGTAAYNATTPTGHVHGGIAWDHLMNYSSYGNIGYNSKPHGWLGMEMHSTPGHELSNMIMCTREGVASTSEPLVAQRWYATGEITTPRNPAFHAYGTGLANQGTEGNHGSWVESFDRSGDYVGGTTNVFTAPVDGVYAFYAHANFNTATSTPYYFRAFKNAGGIGIFYGSGANQSWDHISAFITVVLDKSDTFEWYYRGDPDEGAEWAQCGGYLIG